MGVIFLYSFISEQVPNGVHDVNILQEIENYKRKTNKTPIIVIDLFSIMSLTSDKDDYYFHENGRYKMGIRTQQCEDLYKKLIAAGAKLVFFTDATVLDHKFETWSERRNREFKNIRETFDNRYDGKSDINISLDSLMLQANWEIIASQYGELNQSIDNECDLELAAYATENDVLAVFANDSDYLIFEGQWRYWSMKDIDCETLITREYNRIALREHLNLTEKQMPLLASLNGNDIIKSDRLYDFHKEIGAIYKNRFYALAKFIKTYPEELSRAMINEVALRALPENRAIVLKDFLTSLDSYNIKKLEVVASNNVLKLTKRNNFLENYRILRGHAEIVLALQVDLEIFDYNELVIPIIRRKFGILFQHKNDPGHRCLIYVRKYFPNNNEDTHSVVKNNILPEYPSFTVPPLDELFSDQETESLEMIRWKMLYWCLSLDTKDMKKDIKINKAYDFVPYFCVKFLKERGCIEEFEEKAILFTVFEIKTKGIKPIEDYPKPIIPRVVHLTFLFSYLFFTIRECFEACGFKMGLDAILQFDGVLFHENYCAWQLAWPIIDREESKTVSSK